MLLDHMLYELRVYEVIPGRMPALLARFANPTAHLFVKYGMEVLGFWTTVVGEGSNEFTYILKFEDMSDREKKWAAFQADPEWKAAKVASEKDGQLVLKIRNQFLAPTAFSPQK
jgi:hypothetical protein